jgi:glycosyltransferase involved in cell wall biosynthesis
MGTISLLKNQLLSLKVMNYLVNKKEEKGFYLILAGDSNASEFYTNRLRSYIYENNLEEYCFLTGAVRKEVVYSLYKQADVCLLTSLTEGMPFALVESLAFGKPLISVNVGGVSEVIRDRFNGFLVNYDEIEIAELLIEMRENKADYEEMRRACLNTFSEKFDLEKNMEKTESIMFQTQE